MRHLEKKTKAEIIAWLSSDRNYDLGVMLYQKHGKNKNLKALFPGRDNRFRDKLAYELGKLAGVDFRAIKQVRQAVVVPKEVIVQRVSEPVKDNSAHRIMKDSEELPTVIRRVIHDFHQNYTERSVLHKQLKRVAPDNLPKNVLERKQLSDKMKIKSARLDLLARAKLNFDKTGELPDEQELFGKPKQTDPVKESPDELRKRKLNLQKSLSKAYNRLMYQAQTKQKKKNPLPDGPARTKLELRIKSIEEDLKQIEILLSDGQEIIS